MIYRKLQRVARQFSLASDRIKVRRSFTHLHGPARFKLADNEVALVVLGRNVAHFLPECITYHRTLGVGPVVYVDNNSDDCSVELARQFDNVIVAACSANFRDHQATIRTYSNTLYVQGGWRLAIDPDELFEYPGMSNLKISELTAILEQRGHNALVAQMLEMVPSGPLSAAQHLSFPDAIASYTHYDLRNISRHQYHSEDNALKFYADRNTVSWSGVEFMYGGLRKTVFGENCCLTKHPLFRIDAGVIPMEHPHVTTGVHCADFTALLKHYKFSGGMLERERKLLQENRISHSETRKRVSRLNDDHDLDLSKVTTLSEPTPNKLLNEGFLAASDDAREALGL